MGVVLLPTFGIIGVRDLTGYVVPGCVEDGTWMLWENSSAAVGVVLARSFLDKFSKQIVMFIHFSWKIAFWDIFDLEGRF